MGVAKVDKAERFVSLDGFCARVTAGSVIIWLFSFGVSTSDHFFFCCLTLAMGNIRRREGAASL